MQRNLFSRSDSLVIARKTMMANGFIVADSRTLVAPTRVTDGRGWSWPRKGIHLKSHSINLSETSKPAPTDDDASKHQQVAAMKKSCQNHSNSATLA